jgi:2',3'-cyclic-nucleotide 2'-phosphodiesterase (5'-nucleotidase family)
VEQLLWKQKVCIIGAGVWGKYVGKLDIEFDEHGVIESCTGDALPLGDDIAPVSSIQVRLITTTATTTIHMRIVKAHVFTHCLQAEVAREYNVSMAGLSRVIGSAEVALDYNVRTAHFLQAQAPVSSDKRV